MVTKNAEMYAGLQYLKTNSKKFTVKSDYQKTDEKIYFLNFYY